MERNVETRENVVECVFFVTGVLATNILDSYLRYGEQMRIIIVCNYNDLPVFLNMF